MGLYLEQAFLEVFFYIPMLFHQVIAAVGPAFCQVGLREQDRTGALPPPELLMEAELFADDCIPC